MMETAQPSDRRPDLVHRVVTLAAIVVLSAGAFNAWSAVVQVRWAATASSIAVVVTLVLGVLAATALTLRELQLVDAGVLVVALYVVGVWLVSSPYFHTVGEAFSPAPLRAQVVAIAAATALGAATVLAYALSPVSRKSLGVLGCVGLPIMAGYAETGLTGVIAIPFAVLAVAGWARTGELGVLGPQSVLRAVCLGCAATAEPLGWVFAPLLVIGVWQLRHDDLPARVATRVVVQFTCVVAVTFVLVSLSWGGRIFAIGSASGLLAVLVPMWVLFVSTADRRELTRAFVRGPED